MTWTIDLSGKAALVTGGATGIGYAISCALLEAGATVVATARTETSLKSCNPDTEHGTLSLLGLDVTNELSIEGLLGQIGRLDILVNSAGMVKRGLEFQSEHFADVINANLMGTQRMAQHCLPKLALTRGCILNIASMWSYFGSRAAPGYTASKTGLVGLTRSLAHAWAELGVRVNAIAPGWIATKMTQPLREDGEQYEGIRARIPMGEWGRPEDIAGAAVFLCSPAASYITGALLPVDGGYTVA